MSTTPAPEPTPGGRPRVVTFTAAGERAINELADRLAAECDTTTASITSLLEEVLTADLGDLAGNLDIANLAVSSQDRREQPEVVSIGETIPGQSPDEAARRRLRAHEADNLSCTPTIGPKAAGPNR